MSAMPKSRSARRIRRIVMAMNWLLAAGAFLPAQSPEEFESLRREVAELRQRSADQQRLIEQLQLQVQSILAREIKPGPPADDALDRALADQGQLLPAEAPPGSAAESGALPGVAQKLLEISLDGQAAAGGSTVPDETLATLQGGGHDPRRRGFTFQQAEVSLVGAVDPYFTAEAHLLFSEHGAELEEAFLVSQALPHGLQLKGGYYLTEFGRLNPTHPHSWSWLDQPVVNTRLFGAEGMRGAGVRLAWLTPAPWYSELFLSVQNASGETMTSFLGEPGEAEETEDHDHAGKAADNRPAVVLPLPRHGAEAAAGAGIGGRPLVEHPVSGLGDLAWAMRGGNAWDLSSQVSAQLGLAGAWGPNGTGPEGRTGIYGLDWVMKWRPTVNRWRWPFLTWETELMFRDYRADAGELILEDGGHEELPAETLEDWGFYSQLLYGPRYPWAIGLRLEHAAGSGDSVGGRDQDPLRDDRTRISPLLLYQISEYSRLRFQYNFDRASHLDEDAHTFWVGIEFLIGQHPAHQY